MSEENHFRCEGCDDPCDIRFKGTDEEPVNCPFEHCDKGNWKRVAVESTKGDIMHVPVIHEKKSEVAEKPRVWEYEMSVQGLRLEINAVDSKTGERIALLFLVEDGILRSVGRTENCLLEEDGYTGQGLQFDSNGAMMIKP